MIVDLADMTRQTTTVMCIDYNIVHKNAYAPSGMAYSTCLFKTQLDECVPSGENAIASCGRAEFSSIEAEQ